MSDLEYSSVFDFGVKAVDREGQFEGYASIFGPPADLQRDIVMSGAFAKTLKDHGGKVPILMGHQMSRIVGFGIEAEEDSKGLRVKGEFTLDSDEGKNAHATARHAFSIGHKLGLSIGYMVPAGGSEYDETKNLRLLHKIDLMEYSIAATPACPRARMQRVKSGAMTVTDIEDTLRDAGFSRNEAKRIIADCKALRDAVPDDEEEAKALREAWAAELRERSAKARGALLVNSFREVRTSWLQER